MAESPQCASEVHGDFIFCIFKPLILSPTQRVVKEISGDHNFPIWNRVDAVQNPEDFCPRGSAGTWFPGRPSCDLGD